MRKTFEDLHANHKIAFLDGAVTAAVLCGFAWWSTHRAKDDPKSYTHEEYTTASSYMYKAGINDTYIKLIPFVDMDAYKKHYNVPYLPSER